jgi:hypothetical protein
LCIEIQNYEMCITAKPKMEKDSLHKQKMVTIKWPTSNNTNLLT